MPSVFWTSSPFAFTARAFSVAAICLPDSDAAVASAHSDFIHSSPDFADSSSSLLTLIWNFFFDSSSTRVWMFSTIFGTSVFSVDHSVFAEASAAAACFLPEATASFSEATALSSAGVPASTLSYSFLSRLSLRRATCDSTPFNPSGAYLAASSLTSASEASMDANALVAGAFCWAQPVANIAVAASAKNTLLKRMETPHRFSGTLLVNGVGGGRGVGHRRQCGRSNAGERVEHSSTTMPERDSHGRQQGDESTAPVDDARNLRHGDREAQGKERKRSVGKQRRRELGFLGTVAEDVAEHGVAFERGGDIAREQRMHAEHQHVPHHQGIGLERK